jgi:hypothetical protein
MRFSLRTLFFVTATVAVICYGAYWLRNLYHSQLRAVNAVLAEHPEIDRVWLSIPEVLTAEHTSNNSVERGMKADEWERTSGFTKCPQVQTREILRGKKRVAETNGAKKSSAVGSAYGFLLLPIRTSIGDPGACKWQSQ